MSTLWRVIHVLCYYEASGHPLYSFICGLRFVQVSEHNTDIYGKSHEVCSDASEDWQVSQFCFFPVLLVFFCPAFVWHSFVKVESQITGLYERTALAGGSVSSSLIRGSLSGLRKVSTIITSINGSLLRESSTQIAHLSNLRYKWPVKSRNFWD